ncbi:hypothetical protein EC604_14925 [Paenibacillus amylolyticus]|uniref:Uncharacterized protein n=1 Tax=Paenibacillus amylolyticus TaxID=1451 RepID=A0A5M9WU22_PAEAM|nr:hypothetical protein [Paenibacillus amylolyticus]KAA8785136.1 hypothetical protein EC604_14925 [Paenibacillus amylolyticus]
MKNRLSYVIIPILIFVFFSIFTNKDVHAEVNRETLEQEVSQEQISAEMDDIMIMQNAVAEILGDYEKIQKYGTVHIDRNNGFTIIIAFKYEDNSTDAIKKTLSERLNEKVRFIVSDITYDELTQIKDNIFGNREILEAKGIQISSAGVDEKANKVNVIINKVDNMTIASQLFTDNFAKSTKLLTDNFESAEKFVNVVFDPEAKNYNEFSRRENHSILGGGIGIQSSGSCSTAFTATKGGVKFLATAGWSLS